MSNIVEVLVPDIGNFDSVDVIEVLVKAGDTIAKEDSLITLESDKASMDIPSSPRRCGKGSESQSGRQSCQRFADFTAGNRSYSKRTSPRDE